MSRLPRDLRRFRQPGYCCSSVWCNRRTWSQNPCSLKWFQFHYPKSQRISSVEHFIRSSWKEIGNKAALSYSARDDKGWWKLAISPSWNWGKTGRFFGDRHILLRCTSSQKTVLLWSHPPNRRLDWYLRKQWKRAFRMQSKALTTTIGWWFDWNVHDRQKFQPDDADFIPRMCCTVSKE